MISPDAQPINHIPPRKPISLRPTYPHVQKEHWEEQIEKMAWAAAVARGERMWRVVVEFARTPGSMPTDAPHLTRGALKEVEASGIADEEQNEPVDECAALEDDRKFYGTDGRRDRITGIGSDSQ